MEFSRRSMLSGLGLAAGAGAHPVASANVLHINNLREEIEKEIQAGGVLELPAGELADSGIEINQALAISGVPGHTRIVSPDGRPIFILGGDGELALKGISFSGDCDALVIAEGASRVSIHDCAFENGKGSGIHLEGSGGDIIGNRFSRIAKTAIFARDSKGLSISDNTISDIGNNGIQVWSSEPREDGTIVSGNRIARIAAEDGGTGQNGNGINVYRAGNVMVTGNRISDCAFSAVRNNSGSNCQISNNSISRTGEVAIYCEFGFEGAIVSGNILEDVAFGISITNFNEGGRLAAVANNIIRRVSGGGVLAYTRGIGIAVEADTLVTGNVIEEATDTGVSLGWGKYSRNLSATGNLVRNCGRGISFSVSIGADPVLIANNRISGAMSGAIVGSDHGEEKTPDPGLTGRNIISGNLIS